MQHAFQDGDTEVINGVTYKRRGGQWVPDTAGGGSSPVYGAPPKVAPLPPYAAEDQGFQRDAAERSAAAERRAIEQIDYQRRRDAIQDERAAAKDAAPPKDPKVTEGERAAAGYYRRALNAHENYGAGVLPRSAIAQGAVDMLPNAWENTLASPERREAQNYADEFIRAKLRKESGAAIPTEEMSREYRVYFPVPGDEPVDLERKARLRQEALEALKIGAGSEAGTALEGLLPPEGAQRPNTTPEGNAIYQPGEQGVELSDGERTRIENDPTLAGVNGKVNAMMKAGAPDKDIADYLESAGVPPRDVQNLQAAFQFRRDNPNYKGNYSVNIDDREVPMSGFRATVADAANSDIGAAAVAAGNIVTGNRLDNIVGATGGNAEIANIGMDILRRENPYSSMVGDVAGGVGLYGAGRAAMGAVGRAAAPATRTFAPRAIAGDAAMGGYIASGADGTEMFSTENALLGAAAGVGGGVLGRGAINTTARAVSPSGGALAPFYAEGGQPSLGQRMGGVANRAEQAFSNIPLAGGIQRASRNQAVEQWQSGAFNKALREIDGIGGVVGKLPEGVKTGVQAHQYMQTSFNKAYDQARSGLTFKPDPQFSKDYTDLLTNEVAGLGGDAQRVFKNYVIRGENALKAGGNELSGDRYKNLVSSIEGKVRGLRKNPSGDTELADALEGLSLLLDKNARRHSAPEAIEALDKADRGYVMAVLIEEAARQRGTDIGEFTGKNLEGAILNNSGRRSRRALRGDAPLQDYAQAGKQLGQTMPDSGTAERLMYGGGTAGAMGAASQFVSPIALAPWAMDTLANIPGFKQALNVLIAPNRRGLDPARRRLMERAHFGGLLAAPSAAEATAP